MNHQKAKKGKLCIVRISSPLLQTESYIEVDGVTCRQFTRVNCHVYVDEMVMLTGRVEKQSFKVMKWKMKEQQQNVYYANYQEPVEFCITDVSYIEVLRLPCGTRGWVPSIFLQEV